MTSDTYADLGGGITDPREDRPCDATYRCDGMGMNRFLPTRTREFVECPVHRPAPKYRAARPLRTRHLTRVS